MIRTVIFDLDGTLLNTIADLAAAGNWVCRENGWATYSVDDFQKMVGHGIPNLVKQFSPADAQSPAQQERALQQFFDYYGAHNLDFTRPYDGIPELLDALRANGMQLAVYSNKADVFSQEIVHHFFPGVFQLVRGKLPEVPVKPDPTGTRQVLESLQANPAETCFVGDSDVDIHTGHNAGLRACGVTWGFRSRESLAAAGADALADTPAELLDILLGKDA